MLKKKLAAAEAEIQSLTLRLSNVTLLLRKEMIAGGKIPGSPLLPADSTLRDAQSVPSPD